MIVIRLHLNSESGYKCGFMAALMKNDNAKCYNLSHVLFIFHPLYVLTAQVAASLNTTKASFKRDSAFNTATLMETL